MWCCKVIGCPVFRVGDTSVAPHSCEGITAVFGGQGGCYHTSMEKPATNSTMLFMEFSVSEVNYSLLTLTKSLTHPMTCSDQQQ